MNAIVSAPLLLENEALRECLRLREAQAAAPVAGLLVGGVLVKSVVRPAALALFQKELSSVTSLRECPGQASLGQPQDWPDVLRQLHWELSSSTTLRPLANLMGKAALLPDPANLQGGLRHSGGGLPAVLRQHPVTRLYTILRVDTVIAGKLNVVPDAGAATAAWSLEAGDVLILNADLPVHETLSPDACVWTAYYYSPDPCCCKTAAAKQ